MPLLGQRAAHRTDRKSPHRFDDTTRVEVSESQRVQFLNELARHHAFITMNGINPSNIYYILEFVWLHHMVIQAHVRINIHI